MQLKHAASLAEDVDASIDKNHHIYTTFLARLVAAASPNPPGNTANAIEVIRRFMAHISLIPKSHIEIVSARGQEARPNLIARFNGGAGPGETVILNGHVDTYPGEACRSGMVADGKVYGRGAVDMKAGTAALVIAFCELFHRRAELCGTVGLMCVSDEETGGQYGTRFLLENPKFGKDWHGDVVLNAEPSGLQSIRFGEKGTLRLTFTVTTKGQNGAYTFLSRGAIVIAAKLIEELVDIVEKMEPEMEPELKRYLQSDEVRKIADEIMGHGAGKSILLPTVNIGTIYGGLKVNMVPEQCVFEADIRLPPGLDASTVLDQIHEILKRFPEARLQKQVAASNPSAISTKDHPLAKLLADSAEMVTGRRPLMITGLGATDCKFFRYRSIPAYTLGPSPEGMGSSEEAISIKEYFATARAHTRAVCLHLGVDAYANSKLDRPSMV